MSNNTGNPFARNSRATGRAPYTFGRGSQAPLRLNPTQNFPIPPNHHHRNQAHRGAPAPHQGNHIPRAPGHAPNPFQQHAPAPLPPLYHTHHRTTPLPTDADYARQQTRSYTCACPVRLYANHAALCTGPTRGPRAHITPLGRLGNAGSAVASVPPLVWLMAAVAAVARACVLRVGGVAAGVAAAAGGVLQWVVGEAAPVVTEWVVVAVGLAVLGVVVWWGAVTAANVYMWAVTWRRPAEYYTLRKGFSFLGNVSPPAGAGVASTPLVPVVQQAVEVVKGVTSYLAPAGTSPMVLKTAEELSRSTFSFGTCPALSAQPCPLQGYNVTNTGSVVIDSLVPGKYPIGGSLMAADYLWNA